MASILNMSERDYQAEGPGKTLEIDEA